MSRSTVKCEGEVSTVSNTIRSMQVHLSHLLHIFSVFLVLNSNTFSVPFPSSLNPSCPIHIFQRQTTSHHQLFPSHTHHFISYQRRKTITPRHDLPLPSQSQPHLKPPKRRKAGSATLPFDRLLAGRRNTPFQLRSCQLDDSNSSRRSP
jgi:hypothetical protein